MPNSKQRREAARRHLERQTARRSQREQRRRKATLAATVFGVLVLVVVVVTAVVMLTNDDKKIPAASANPSDSTTAGATPSASPSNDPYAIAGKTAPAKTGLKAKVTAGACKYDQNAADVSNPETINVGLPPDPAKTPATGTQNVTLATTRGEIDIQLNRADAPCAVQSWDYLIGKKFYDQTPCHRLVNSGIYVLQCGDPTGTGSGGTTYRYKEENLAKVSYGEGVVAMAKQTAAGTTGSQFFIIYKDSNTGLGKDYSVVGKVTKGLDIVQQVAAGGLAADGTAPKLAIGIKSMTFGT